VSLLIQEARDFREVARADHCDHIHWGMDA
jgi:hypothetical protein